MKFQVRLGHKTFLTLDDWRNAITSDFDEEKGSEFMINEVAFVAGCPDYEAGFNDCFGKLGSMVGIMRSQIWRAVNSPNGDDIIQTYKENTLPGWLPRLFLYILAVFMPM